MIATGRRFSFAGGLGLAAVQLSRHDGPEEAGRSTFVRSGALSRLVRVSNREDQSMIRKSYPWLWLLAGVLTGLIISNRFVLLAQDRGEETRSDRSRTPRTGGTEETTSPVSPSRAEGRPTDASAPVASSGAANVQDVLLRPYRFSFSRPTPLSQVCVHLRQTLKVPVVLDLAALGRQDVEPEDTVQLELDGVRLKTGLKLLLDQVGLTYHVVAEDNLLIITDRNGSEDPLDRIWTELHALHRDLHDVQDAVDDLTDAIGGEAGEGPRVRKPTIIEEIPEKDRDKPEGVPAKPEAHGRKPNGALAPAPVPRATPSQIPLRGPRRPL
jgi:hypothetical protein